MATSRFVGRPVGPPTVRAEPLLLAARVTDQSGVSSVINEQAWRAQMAPPVPAPPSSSEIALDQGPRRQPFRSNRTHGGPRQHGHRQVQQRLPGIRLPSDGRHKAQNARNNYERYTTMAKDTARRGDVVEAENLYQHAEHYFRVMREQGSQ